MVPQCAVERHANMRGGPSVKHQSATCHMQTAGCGDPVVLVHGFGASSGHYRKNIAVLSKQYKVSTPERMLFPCWNAPLAGVLTSTNRCTQSTCLVSEPRTKPKSSTAWSSGKIRQAPPRPPVGSCEVPGSRHSITVQVLDFMSEFVQVPAVIVGNSIGSLACLMVGSHGGSEPL